MAMEIKGGAEALFILPDEGKTPDDLLEDPSMSAW